MNCPACQTENAAEALACSNCGRSLRAASAAPPGRRSGSRRRNSNGGDAAVAEESNNPAAWRAYRVALWSLVPGLGLVLGPAAVVLGWLAVRGAGDDASARNRAKASFLLGALVALTQWVGFALMFYGWRG